MSVSLSVSRRSEEAVAATIARRQGGRQDAHPLQIVYDRLAMVLPRMPRDAEGHIDSTYARAALAVEGIDEQVLSTAGFSMLLAYCDVSTTGFPSFADFILCFSSSDHDHISKCAMD